MKRSPILMFALLLWSCFDEGNCILNFTDQVILAFKNSQNQAQNIDLDSVSARGVTLQNYTGKQVNKVSLPVDPVKDTTLFIFYYSGAIDSLEVAYKREAVILTSDCGARNFVTRLGITYTDLDSVRLINDKLLTDVNTHVEVFF